VKGIFNMARWIVFAGISVLFWGAWALTFAAASAMMSPMVALVLSTAGLLPVSTALCFGRNVWRAQHMPRGFGWGMLTGVCGALGNAAYSEAIVRGGEASIVTPLTAMFPLVTLLLALAVLRERIGVIQGLGIGVALVAILLFNAAGSDGIDARSLFAGIGSPWMIAAVIALGVYGIQGVTQKLSTNEISNELSTISYLAGSGVVALFVVATQNLEWHLPFEAWALVLGSGIFMGMALWAGFAAYRGGKASVVTALLALYPVVTVFMAIPILGESLTLPKGAAIVLALLAGLSMTYDGTVTEAELDGVRVRPTTSTL
jgi:drug/metabolite transporter (DMT)-like permease